MNIEDIDTEKLKDMLDHVATFYVDDDDEFERIISQPLWFGHNVTHEYEYLVSSGLATPRGAHEYVGETCKTARLHSNFKEFLREYRKMSNL